MSVTVCSGWHPAGFEQYGRDFITRFDEYWHPSVRLVVYVEQLNCLGAVPWNRVVLERSVMRCIGLAPFIDRHKDIAEHCGRKPDARWKERERAAGYSYKWDAVKFCKQLFIPKEASLDLPDGDILVWLDADVMTFKKVPADLPEYLLAGHDLCFLGRGEKHSEIGFWAVRLNARSRRFLARLADVYRTDEVFTLAQWHSAFVFDYVRKNSDVRAIDLTPGGRGHVWFQSPLGAYMDHCKGDRKGRGSPECLVKWWKD